MPRLRGRWCFFPLRLEHNLCGFSDEGDQRIFEVAVHLALDYPVQECFVGLCWPDSFAAL